ncbi:penicillin acylase family protein [Bacteroidota bacterium]
MKIFKRIGSVLVLLLIVILVGGLLLLNYMQKTGIPDYEEDVDLENMTEEVRVIRDSLGIPHIYAQNEEDLYRVVGYVTAQDRMWQMDLMRRATMGRLAEIFGEDFIAADQLTLALDFVNKSERIIASSDPEVITALEAFSDGVNQFIEQNKNHLSFEFKLLGYKPETWTPVHSINVINYMAWHSSGSSWATDLDINKLASVLEDSLFRELYPFDYGDNSKKIHPDYMKVHPQLVENTLLEKTQKQIGGMGLKAFEASNNWAVSGDRSETGKPLMANDTHLELFSPGYWYQMHQVVEGKLNVTGVILPGIPFIAAGHNEDISWGITYAIADNLDFYQETLNPLDSNQYKLDGTWKKLVLKEETIPVKGLNEPVKRLNRFTHRGPVVSEFKGVEDKAITIRWVGMDDSYEMTGLYLLNKASNWEEYREALSKIKALSLNLIYADRHGNIGMQLIGAIPIREGVPVMMFPGDTSLHDWTADDIIPFENLPYTYNPESGIVASANNKQVSDDYPYYIGTYYSLPNRFDRINELLNDSRGKHSVESFKRIQTDQVSVFARRLTPVFIEAVDGKTDSIFTEALDQLKKWDYRMDKDLPAAAIYEHLFNELIPVIYKDELGPRNYNLFLNNSIFANYHLYKLAESRTSLWCDDITTADVRETFSNNIEKAFFKAVDSLSAMLGPIVEDWKWGDMHTLTYMHPMGEVNLVRKLFNPNLGPYRIGGSAHTVAPFSYPLGRNYKSGHGASQRHVYSTAAWDASKSVLPIGNCAIPSSPFYGNQAPLYLNFKYHDDSFSKAAVEERKAYEAVFN